ncbi:hypothetical protein CAP35_14765 [Chitinophagaceae bacterium IBVUCB1]|nr:hypothetical protein CAP35_14765 [Chitinophagaceae bacterium IBVUCB1]
MRAVITAAITAAFFLQGCNIINPTEQVPTYIKIDSLRVVSNDLNKTGSTSSKISSVWVYADNALLGAYDLPANIPVPINSSSFITLSPGISFSGLKSFQVLYPFYSNDTFNLKAMPGKTYYHTGKVSYNEAAQFQWKEDFETGNTFLKLYDYKTEDTSLVRTTDPSKVFEGGSSGYIYLTTTHPNSENINNKDIPVKTGEAYIEVNYKCNTPFEVGLQTSKSGQPYSEYIGGVKANESWSKMYIGVQTFIGTYSASSVRLLVKAKLPEGASNAYVLIDNIKLITY